MLCVFIMYTKKLIQLEHNVYIYCHITSRPGVARVTHHMTTINLLKSGEKNASPLANRKKKMQES